MNNAHLSNQNYDICIRRIRGYCSVCFSPHIMSTANDQGASFGMSANNNPSAPTAQSAMGTLCNGKTSMNPDPTNAAHLGIINIIFFWIMEFSRHFFYLNN